jgi:hypothetical protein
VGITAIADALLEQDAFGGLPAQVTILREETLSYCTLRSDDTKYPAKSPLTVRRLNRL